MHLADCLCADVPTLAVRTWVVLVMHRRELHKTTATGPLALLALPDARRLVHGDRDDRVHLGDVDEPGRRGLILVPDAEPLSDALLARDPRPVTLVVPDGSWRQASKAARRLPGVERFERVGLPAGPPTRWGLRDEPKAGGLSTLEAIARALGVIEGPAVQAALEALFDTMVARTLGTRQSPATR
jgi:DTW domain-containing protein YfiP